MQPRRSPHLPSRAPAPRHGGRWHRDPRVLPIGLLLSACAGCGGSGDTAGDTSQDTSPPPDTSDTAAATGPDPSTWLPSLPAAGDLGRLTAADRGIKYTAPIEGRAREAPILEDAYFQDMEVWPWHLQFLLAFPELQDMDMPTYEAWVIENATRRWWGGEVRLWPGTIHPVTGVQGVFTWTFYSDDSGGGTTVDMVDEVRRRMDAVAPWSAGLSAWVPDGSAQQALAASAGGELAARGIPVLDLGTLVDPLVGDTPVEGEAEGILSIGEAVPGGILATEVLPGLDPFPEVAAVLVASVPAGDPSLDTLRARGTPVAVVPASANAVVQALAGAPVHVTVAGGTCVLFPLESEVP